LRDIVGGAAMLPGFSAKTTTRRCIGNKTLTQPLSWYPTHSTHNEDMAMDKDRIKGSVQQAKGVVKEAAGKVFGDKKLETEGKIDKAAGKMQNAVGGFKDAVRGK
jgi:uncharacterized protein YjbJ (UPF0337 family)